MNWVLVITAALALSELVNADCGCLKCSKDLTVVSPPHHPCKIIYKHHPHFVFCNKPMPVEVQVPVIPPAVPYIPKDLDYQISGVHISHPHHCQYAYPIEVQAPVIAPPKPPTFLTGLRAVPDRVVLHTAPVCVQKEEPCHPIWHNTITYHPHAVKPVPKIQPIFEKLGHDDCDYRYDRGRRKREIPILKQSVDFVMGLLPDFIKLPIRQTLKTLKYHQRISNEQTKRYYDKRAKKYRPKHYYRNEHKAPIVLYVDGDYANKVIPRFGKQPSLLEKLQKLNENNIKTDRRKRSLEHSSSEMVLPFFRVTEVENQLNSREDDSAESDLLQLRDSQQKYQQKRRQQEEFLEPLNFGHLMPHNPIFYMLNAPIRLLHQLHKFGQQISPVFKSVPQVLVNSRRYLRDFGRNFKNDVLNFASDLVGDFDELGSTSTTTKWNPFGKYGRFRRSPNSSDLKSINTSVFRPKYTVVFNQSGTDEDSKRSKRYILKVVDEDEVQEFLQEKLGTLVANNKPEAEKSRKKKKLVVEKLSSKIIIDNNGRPFAEINGFKRPLFLNKDSAWMRNKKHRTEENEEDITKKITKLIEKAKTQDEDDQGPKLGPRSDICVRIIRDKVTQILTQVQNLITMDFNLYNQVQNDLTKLQNFKDYLVADWRKMLTGPNSNDISCRMRMLNDFHEMQQLKDAAVKNIAAILDHGGTFMTKNLIKMLVRLQKLQCIIFRAVEDFGINMNTSFDARKEMRYVDFLANLQFLMGRTKSDLDKDLKEERDKALDNELKLLERLRRMLEEHPRDSFQTYEEAKLLWEIKNIEKLQKDTVTEMNLKIGQGQKVRKELKILFDLMRQLESCEDRQGKLLVEIKHEKSHTQDPYHNHEYHYHYDQSKSAKPYRHTIIEDKRPVKLTTNGYSLTGYKVSDTLR